MRVLGMLVLAAMLLGALPSCRREAGAPATTGAGGASDPAQAVLLLTGHLRDDDLAAFVRDAVPAALHRQLEAAWRQGRTRWPLDELPLDERLPAVLDALAEPGSEQRLQLVFDHQFAGETRAIRTAATTLATFGAQYVQRQPGLGREEREHDLQIVQALGQWAAGAPLGDPARARPAIARLAAAARATGLRSEADFARLGMQASLGRLSGFVKVAKQVLAGYGLDLDRGLGAMTATTVSRRGDRAQVRMRYRLGDRPVEALVQAERVGERWYLSDTLRRARQAAADPMPQAPAAAAPAGR